MLQRPETRNPAVAAIGGIGMPAWRLVMLGAGLIVLAAIPFALKNFYIFQITLAIIYAIAILGLNLLTGFNGQFSLGHSAFYAIGAYTAAIMMANLGIRYVCATKLVSSRTGRALIAIRDHPVAASAMGINVSLYKSLTFGVSALYTGVAGALGAIAISFVAPDSFTFVLAVALFVGLVVGGVASIPGTLVGGLFVLFIPNIAESVSKGLAGAVYGVILLVVIYLMPTGAAGLVRWAVAKLVRQRR